MTPITPNAKTQSAATALVERLVIQGEAFDLQVGDRLAELERKFDSQLAKLESRFRVLRPRTSAGR